MANDLALNQNIDSTQNSTVNENQDVNLTKTQAQPDPSEIVTKSYSRGINDGRERQLKEFAKNGLNVVLDANGDVNYTATLANIAQPASKVQEPAQSSGKSNDQVEALKAKLEIFEAQIKKTESEKAQYIVDSEVQSALSGHSLIDGVGKKAVVIFKSEYEIGQIANGEIHVKQNGKLLLNNFGDPMSVKEAVDKFISENGYLVKAQGRGASPSKNSVQVGGKKQVTRADLAEGRVTPEEIRKGIEIVDL